MPSFQIHPSIVRRPPDFSYCLLIIIVMRSALCPIPGEARYQRMYHFNRRGTVRTLHSVEDAIDICYGNNQSELPIADTLEKHREIMFSLTKFKREATFRHDVVVMLRGRIMMEECHGRSVRDCPWWWLSSTGSCANRNEGAFGYGMDSTGGSYATALGMFTNWFPQKPTDKVTSVNVMYSHKREGWLNAPAAAATDILCASLSREADERTLGVQSMTLSPLPRTTPANETGIPEHKTEPHSITSGSRIKLWFLFAAELVLLLAFSTTGICVIQCMIRDRWHRCRWW